MLRSAIIAGAIGLSVAQAATAQTQEVTVGYQLVYSPWALPIQQETFEAATGHDVRWVKFDSGAEVISASRGIRGVVQR